MGLEDLTERLFGLGKYNKGTASTQPVKYNKDVVTTQPVKYNLGANTTQSVKSNLEEVLKKKKKLGTVDTGINAIKSGRLGAPVLPKD